MICRELKTIPSWRKTPLSILLQWGVHATSRVLHAELKQIQFKKLYISQGTEPAHRLMFPKGLLVATSVYFVFLQISQLLHNVVNSKGSKCHSASLPKETFRVPTRVQWEIAHSVLPLPLEWTSRLPETLTDTHTAVSSRWISTTAEFGWIFRDPISLCPKNLFLKWVVSILDANWLRPRVLRLL